MYYTHLQKQERTEIEHPDNFLLIYIYFECSKGSLFKMEECLYVVAL